MTQFGKPLLVTCLIMFPFLAGCGRSFEDDMATEVYGSDEFWTAMIVMFDEDHFASVPANAVVVIVDHVPNPEPTAYVLTGTEERRRFLADRFRADWWTERWSNWSNLRITAQDQESLDERISSQRPDAEIVVTLGDFAGAPNSYSKPERQMQ